MSTHALDCDHVIAHGASVREASLRELQRAKDVLPRPRWVPSGRVVIRSRLLAWISTFVAVVAFGAVQRTALAANGTVLSELEITAGQSDFTGTLELNDDFGKGVAALGDLDGDNIDDIAVGAFGDDDGGTNRGAVWILFLNSDGTVKSHQKISSTSGDFTGTLDNEDRFGASVTALGDLDGDNVVDLAVGASLDDDGSADAGALWILFLNSNGTVKSHQKISAASGGFTGALGSGDLFGAYATTLGDFDGDNVLDIAVGARLTDDGGTDRGAVWILYLNNDGTVKSHGKISDTAGGFTGTLDNEDQFGVSMASLGDLDGDGILELAVGAFFDDDGGLNHGALWVLFLNSDGTVKSHQKISDWEGGFTGTLEANDQIGVSVAAIGDVDCDGTVDIVAGAHGDDDGGSSRGSVYILFLNGNGTVKSHQKISNLEGGLVGPLGNLGWFGFSVAPLGDFDGDGKLDLAVGAPTFVEQNRGTGGVWLLFLDGQEDCTPIEGAIEWAVNGHCYEVRKAPDGITWQEAEDICISEGGHLATITSAEENAFIARLMVGRPDLWTPDGAGNGLGPWLGGLQLPGSPEPDGGWVWNTGEAMVYDNWRPGEPNNCCNFTCCQFDETRMHFFAGGSPLGVGDQWNDAYEAAQFLGYVIEWDAGGGPCAGATVTVTVSGTVTSDCAGPMQGVTVDFVDASGELSVATTDAAGDYSFPEVSHSELPDAAEISISIPLGFEAVSPGVGGTTLTLDQDRTVDFALACLSPIGGARSMGYWKHNANVYLRNRGNAQESEADMTTNYPAAVFNHFHANGLNGIAVEGVTFVDAGSGPEPLDLGTIGTTLSVKGNAGMIAKAKQQYLGLLLNIASGKLQTYAEVSVDGMTASQALQYVADCINDADSSNDEAAKDICDAINNAAPVPAGMIPQGYTTIHYARAAAEDRPLFIISNPAGSRNYTFSFAVPVAGHVALEVYNVAGRKVATVLSDSQPAGHRKVTWSGRDFSGRAISQGIYFARLKTAHGTSAEKFVHLAR